MKIGERIIYILKEKGLTQKGLAEFVGIKQSTISDWKGKGTNPSSEIIYRICEYLNVSPTYILTGKEELNNITTEEKEILKKYNILTERNKGKVETYIDERISEQKREYKTNKEA